MSYEFARSSCCGPTFSAVKTSLHMNIKEFNEHLGRKKGYSLNMIGKFLNWILTKFFSKYYSNVAVFICKKNK